MLKAVGILRCQLIFLLRQDAANISRRLNRQIFPVGCDKLTKFLILIDAVMDAQYFLETRLRFQNADRPTFGPLYGELVPDNGRTQNGTIESSVANENDALERRSDGLKPFDFPIVILPFADIR